MGTPHKSPLRTPRDDSNSFEHSQSDLKSSMSNGLSGNSQTLPSPGPGQDPSSAYGPVRKKTFTGFDYESDAANQIENSHWDLYFQNLWSCLVAADMNFKATMQLSEKLFKHIAAFKQEAKTFVKDIVNELHMEIEHRRY